jgi:hypothetical protein
MSTPEKQHLFCSLIEYYQSGDISTFERICTLSGFVTPNSPRYLLFNYLNAASMVGFIEISETEHSTRWTSSIRPAIRINSGLSKLIGTTKSVLKSSNTNLKPLAEDDSGQVLVWGQKGVGHFYDNNWLSLRCDPSVLLGPASGFVEQIVEEQNLNLESGLEVETFNLLNRQWQIVEASALRSPALIREKRQYSGSRYRIVLPELKLAFRILYPEWAFLVTARVLRWEFDKCVRVSGGDVYFDARFRLPTILKRYLFANSDSVTIGRSTVFKKIEQKALSAFRSFVWE